MRLTSVQQRAAVSICASVKSAVDRYGATLIVLNVPAKQLSARGMFSDWPAKTTF